MVSPPIGIHAIRSEHVVEIKWSADHVGRHPNKLLRGSCHCARCVDEFTGQPILDPETVSVTIEITAMNLVGNYAVRFVYSDGHDSGIATWAHLRETCPCPACQG